LAADLAILSGAYKRGDEVPVGLAKTLKIIQHRNKILEDSGVNLPIPEATDLYTEQAMLTQYINNIIANNENLSKYQQFYYPAASKCYAYQPTVKAGEELANKFKYHNWYLPSVGELMRMYWHARQGVNYDDDKIGAIFQKAIDAGILNDFSNSWYWSSSEYSQGGSWVVHFSNGYFSNDDKCYSYMVRAVAAF
ncbi:Lcl domain-containing protein, partial [Bacteroides faecis]